MIAVSKSFPIRITLILSHHRLEIDIKGERILRKKSSSGKCIHYILLGPRKSRIFSKYGMRRVLGLSFQNGKNLSRYTPNYQNRKTRTIINISLSFFPLRGTLTTTSKTNHDESSPRHVHHEYDEPIEYP